MRRKAQQEQKAESLLLFYSYAYEDELFREQLEKHLRLLSRQGLISGWHDRQIVAGMDRVKQIDKHLETASIILLLISPDFLASDYCYEIEMRRALERYARSEVLVIPIILRPCEWRETPLAHLQALPHDGTPVSEWSSIDAAFLDIAKSIHRTVVQLSRSAHLSPHLLSLAQQNRQRLLKQVQQIWIEGLLEQSLHQAALISINLQEQFDALDNPWGLQVQETNRPPRPLPTGTSIVQIYDETNGEILILGEPGAGKTTILLELARTLLERAEKDEHQRIPVIFNLSSWAEKCFPLMKWIVEELWTKYRIPRTVGNAWMATDQLLPLLDGLDEVAEDVRSNCLQAINAYRQEHFEKEPAPLIICCRSQEYLALAARVNLQHAVSIQPLTDEQIERYLRSANGELQELRDILHQDSELHELARKPLMLSIFTLAYQGAVRTDLPTEKTSEAQQRQVFASYVSRMLNRRNVSKWISREQMLQWLIFIAIHIQQHHQTIFYLENLQLDWLTNIYTRITYRLSTTLFMLLFPGLFSGLAFGLLSKLALMETSSLNIKLSVEIPTIPNLGLISGVIFGLTTQLLFELVWRLGVNHETPPHTLTWSWRFTKEKIVKGLIYGLGTTLLILITLLLGNLTFYTLNSSASEPTNATQLSNLLSLLVLRLGVALPIGMIVGVLMLVPFSTRQIDELLIPNAGTWSSARTGLGIGVISLLGFGFVLWLLGLPSFGVLLGALCLGWLNVIIGLRAFLEHFFLRFWLWSTGSLPWNLAPFLNEATERLLLRKVGGGYMFIHRLLLDYFITLEKKEI